jgi:hypothetical protein
MNPYHHEAHEGHEVFRFSFSLRAFEPLREIPVFFGCGSAAPDNETFGHLRNFAPTPSYLRALRVLCCEMSISS